MDQQHYRPRSVSELIDGTMRIVRGHIGTLVPLALVGALPLIVLVALLPMVADQEAPDTGLLAMMGAMSILWLFWFPVFEGATVHAAGEAYRGRPSSAGSSLRYSLSRYGRVFGVVILKYAGSAVIPSLVVGFTALVLPIPVVVILALVGVVASVLLFLRLSLLPATVLLEDNGFADGVRRSFGLTEGHKGHIFLAILLIYVIWIAIYLVFYLALSLAFMGAPFVGIVLGQIAGALGYTLFWTLTALLYFDLRIRKEAYDIELMSQALSTDPARSAAI